MISAYSVSSGLLRELDTSRDAADLTSATWIDLLEPERGQEAAVERAFRIDIPTREDVRTIDASSQIYRENNSLVMTARVVSRNEAAGLRLATVTFILTDGKLVTLRYGNPLPFRTFVARATKEEASLYSGEAIMAGLLEAIVNRAAELLQMVDDELEDLSTNIFNNSELASSSASHDLRAVMQKVGKNGDLTKRVRGSLHSLARIVPYLQGELDEGVEGSLAGRLKIVEHDIESLLNHDSYLMSNVTFLLDATLGLINIQQNAIIKIFSVAAVIFLPPTLLASIYGMNFKHMPELDWTFGYPYALGLMVLSAVLPYYYFKRKRWL